MRRIRWIWLALLPFVASGGSIILPPSATSTEGDSSLGRPFDIDPQTTQFVFGGSLLTGMPAGSIVTGLSFRLNQNATAPSGPVIFSNYDIQLSSSNSAPGSLNTAFDTNLGADATTVRSGGLTIPAGALLSGFGPNPFSFLIAFTNPYLYLGGDLLITIRHSGNGSDVITLDGQSDAGVQNIFSAGYSAAASTQSVGAAPVIQLEFSDVPEPATFGVTLMAALVMAARRRR